LGGGGLHHKKDVAYSAEKKKKSVKGGDCGGGAVGKLFPDQGEKKKSMGKPGGMEKVPGGAR